MGPTLTDRYTVLSLLGSGSSGSVWLAQDDALDRFVAIKHFSRDFLDDSDAVRKVLKEAKAAARVNHENVVSIYDVIENGRDGPFIVMEYLSGGTLAALADEDRLDAEAIIQIAIDVSDALIASHEIDLCHLDVKPGNILLTSEGRAKLADFGVARNVFGTAVDERTILGTLAFMAPEVARGETPTAASDIWSMAATMYAALEGHAPHLDIEASTYGTLLTRRMYDAAPPAQSAGPLANLLAEMLTLDPLRRPSARGVAQSLRAIRTHGQKPIPQATKPHRNFRHRRIAASAAGLAALVAFGAFALATHGPPRHVARDRAANAMPSRAATNAQGAGTETALRERPTPEPSRVPATFTNEGSTSGQGPTSLPAASLTVDASASPSTNATDVHAPGSSSSPTTKSSPTQSSSASPSPSGGQPVAETVGSYANTWSDYSAGAGTHGPTIPAYRRVLITCRVPGFVVQDGNKWWYQIASSPWDDGFYVSADAFYNNGSSSGPLQGTPFFDPTVRVCSQ